MAIEGNDWWAVAGAAVGGLAAGLIGSRLASSQKETPYFVNLRRIYVRQGDPDDEPMDAIASIWNDPETGYMVRLAENSLVDYDIGGLETIPDLTDWIGYFDKHFRYKFEWKDFSDPDDAMVWVDEFLNQHHFVPITDWSGPLGKEIPPSEYKKFLIRAPKRLNGKQR